MVSLSSANLEAISMLALGGTNCPASNPSMNLHGMVGHLQVFALSSWFSTNQFIKYSETTRGLMWLIPRHKLPWVDFDSSSSILDKEKHPERSNDLSAREHSNNRDQRQTDLMNLSYIEHKLPFPTEITTKSGRLYNQHNVSKTSTLYGLPLNSIEYFTYFLRGEPIFAGNVIKGMENHKGWQDMEMNLFWLGAVGGCLILVHVFMIFILRKRTGGPPQGSLSVPRFELFLLILMLPCLSQSSTFVIKGGTTGGIITGVLLQAIPAAFILSVLLFLVIAIYSGSFAQYKEFKQVTDEEEWYIKLWFFSVGRPTTGKWFNRKRLPSSFLSRFGILFDNWKGPPVLVLSDQNELNTITKWTESGQSGIGRMKTVNSEDSNEENKISTFKHALGCMRASYIILDLLRRVGLGIISVAYPSEKLSKSLFALIITSIQFIYLFTTKPYISRGVQVVESISLLSEVGMFGILILHSGSNSVEAKTWDLVMLFLLLFTFIVQLINQWYAMVYSLLKLSQPQNYSLRHGIKFAAKGLILPFLPSKHWSSVISTFSQPETDLSVNPTSSGAEFERRNRNGYMDPISAMTATVVPVQSPGTPSPNVIERRDPTTSETAASTHIEVEGKWLKGHKSGLNNELKMLRELAKASFTGDTTRVDEASTSYTLGKQPLSGETYFGNPKRRY
ncbi:uncharacterized protein LOC113863563 [Abrus precatorius]|uniref:Uncharacterized protein LOC113863563 n=1 Tax=Abrus precatorius TaxID=3816 RepID=A0A8B8LDZ9_ABRPR|nr:uncharacterized protein LOC113863563 [Abrus precatorius]